MEFCIVNADGIIENIIMADADFASRIGAVLSYDGASIGEVYDPPEPKPEPEPTPAQLREEAYNTQTIISFDGELLTVTQASQKWQYYSAEGNTIKPKELTELIAEAKAKIREQYPDE